jgi:hypothetical protein
LADRRSVFTDARVIQASEDFVCAADEVWRLQRGSEADCVFFQHTVNRGERILTRSSYQGTWVIAPSGQLLSHVNTRNVEKQLEVLQAGLDAWDELTPAERLVDPNLDLASAHRWEVNLPADGLVLERIGRELNLEGLSSEPHARWNRDFAWAAKSELAHHFEGELEVGSRMSFDELAIRFARFHLIDNVRGQSLPFGAGEIGQAQLRARITSIEGNFLEMVFEGHTAAESSGAWEMGFNLWTPKQRIPHGIECDLVGRGTWDRTSQRFTKFELVAVGRRWGRTTNNGRGRDASPGLVAFHFGINERAMEVAPTFLSLYDADWIVAPAVPTWTDSPDECGLVEEGR